MFKILTGRLVFPDAPKDKDGKTLTLRRFGSVRVESSWKEPVQRAEIILGRNVTAFESQKVREIFKVGHRVEIYLGYDGRDVLEFEGYLTAIGADAPLVLQCQDEMWKVRRIPVNYSARSVTLEKLLADIVKGYPVDALEGVELGKVFLPKTNLGEVLDKLKSEKYLYSYMKGKTLVCGKEYSDDDVRAEVAKIDVDRFAIDNSLKYKHPDEVVLKIKASSILKNGKKVSFEMGEDGGTSLNIEYGQVTAEVDLKSRVEATYKKAKMGGFDGSFTTFGFPRLAHGMRAELTSKQYSDRNGTYYVDGVVKTFGPDGYRQDVKLGGQAK